MLTLHPGDPILLRSSSGPKQQQTYFLLLPKLYAINFLSHRHGQCPHICLPSSVSGFPAKQHNPLEVHCCVILNTDKAEGVDHTVAHSYALYNVKRN